MPEISDYQQHMADLLSRSGDLARQLVDQTQADMRANSADLALANDRQLLFQVAQAVVRHRAAWEVQLEAHMQAQAREALSAASAQADKPLPPHGHSVSLDELTLVDEAQADKDIEISRTVQLIDLSAEWELRELHAYALALRGDATLRGPSHPFQPAVYARALSASVQTLQLPPPEHHMLLRISGKALAQLLRRFYADAVERLREKGHKALPFRANKVPRQPPHSTLNVTQPGALHSLIDKLPEGPSPEQQAGTLVAQLFAHMAQDEGLPPAVKALLATLQPAVAQLARHDPRLMSSDGHPAWQLVNELAAHAMGYAETDHAGLNALVAYMQPRLALMRDGVIRDRGPFDNALRDAVNFIARHSQRELQATEPARSELQLADRRETLRPILQPQIEQQLAGSRISQRVQHFLIGPWVDVLTLVMATGSPDSDEAQAMLSTVDDLLQSLTRPTTLAERDALRRMLPDLIPRLQHGMRLIALPAAAQEALLDELMATHSRYLRATPRPPAPPAELTPQELVQRMRDEMAADSQATSMHTQPGKASTSMLKDTNVGSLPTLPMGYDSKAGTHSQDPALALAWIDALDAGQWCKLCLKGQWASMQLIWVSENQLFFMFSSKGEGRMHPMSQGALLRLRTAGLATSLQERSVMQRAVDSLLQNLGD